LVDVEVVVYEVIAVWGSTDEDRKEKRKGGKPPHQ
jgi:hypothetical protein